MSSDYAVYFAHQTAVWAVHGLTIRYSLTLDGPTVTATHSDLDKRLPDWSIHIVTGEEELLIRSAEWVDRIDVSCGRTYSAGSWPTSTSVSPRRARESAATTRCGWQLGDRPTPVAGGPEWERAWRAGRE